MSSELVAKFCAILNDYRNGKIKDIPKICKSVFDGKNNISADFRSIVNWLKDNGFDEKSKSEDKTIESFSECCKIINDFENKNIQETKDIKPKKAKSFNQAKLNEKIKEIKSVIDVIEQLETPIADKQLEDKKIDQELLEKIKSSLPSKYRNEFETKKSDMEKIRFAKTRFKAELENLSSKELPIATKSTEKKSKCCLRKIETI